MASKEQVLGDQKFFVEQMEAKLGSTVGRQGGQPRADDLKAYFRKLADDPYASWKQYDRYAQAFYIHIDEVGGTSAEVDWRPTDRNTPKGIKTCDSWQQIEARQRTSDGTSRRVIDCRGFSFMARELMTAADWQARGFRVFFIPRDRDVPWHVAVELTWVKTQGMQDLVIGTQQASNGGTSEERNKGYARYPNRVAEVLVTDPPRPTQGEALQAAAAAEAGGKQAFVGSIPFRQPAGSFPPRSVPGRSRA